MTLIYPDPEDEIAPTAQVLRFPLRPSAEDEGNVVRATKRALRLNSRPVGGGMFLCESSPGLPWRNGQLYLEHDPDLYPVYARGLGDPSTSVYWQLRTMPQCVEALDDLTSAIVTAPWRLVRRELPSWAASDPAQVAAWDRHNALAERVWWHWTTALGQRGLHALITEKLEFAFVCGFCLHEIGLEPRVMDLGDGPRVYMFPEKIPELRAPWSVKQWLTQCEYPIGILQTLSQVMNTNGGQEPYEVFIPWRKLDHFTLRQAGPTDLEGMSAIRPARRALLSLQKIYQLQTLSIEVNGVGTISLIKKDATAPPLTEAQREEIAKFFDSYTGSMVPWIIPPDGYEVSIVSPSQSVPDLSNQVVTFERAAGKALNTSHRLIALTGYGSFAARASAQEAAAESLALPASRIADNLEALLARVIRANFAADEQIYVPAVQWSSVDAEVVKAYTDAGYLSPDVGDEEVIREGLGLPAGQVTE